MVVFAMNKSEYFTCQYTIVNYIYLSTEKTHGFETRLKKITKTNIYCALIANTVDMFEERRAYKCDRTTNE